MPPLLFLLTVFAGALAAGLALRLFIGRLKTQKIVALAEKAAPPTGQFIEMEGCRIHHFDSGEGRPILFVHGLGGWMNQLAHPLFPLLQGFRLVSPDRPGSGWSTRPAGGPETIPDQAAFLVRLCERLGLDRPLVVGHSLGGAIAMRMALDFPDRIGGLALISPLTRFEADTPPELKALQIPNRTIRRLVAETISAPLAIKNTAATLALVFGPQQPPADYGTAGGAMAALRPDHFFGASTDAVAAGDTMIGQEKRYGELSLPVGVLFGDGDRVISCDRHGAALAGQIKGLDLEILEGVGHMPHYAEPERVAAFIRRMAARTFAS